MDEEARHLWQRARDAAERARRWPESEGKAFFTTIAHTYVKMALAAQAAQASPARAT